MKIVSMIILAASLNAAAPAHSQTGDMLADVWVYNADGRHGIGGTPAIHAIVGAIPADVTRIRTTATNIYINSSDIPSYSIGPWPNNPNAVSAQNILVRIPRVPTTTATHTNTGLGAIGVLVNGVIFFNARDGRSYLNQGVWNQNAMVVEGPNMDSAMGHPQMTGIYHHHCSPMSLREQLGDHGHCHSPLLGFAYDGFPVYGPFGFADPMDEHSEIVPMIASYRTRTYAGGVRGNGGPNVSAQFPLGYYVEDFEYAAGLGTLDQYNGRICKTPEYPGGTFAYFMTVDAADNPVYPFIVGPQYYGVTLTDNLQRNVQVPGTGVTEVQRQNSFPCAELCHQPETQTACLGSIVVLESDARHGAGVAYQWRRNGEPLTDNATYSGSATDELTIAITAATQGTYDCVISGSCETLVTDPGTLTVCAADFNCDGIANSADFFEFITAFFTPDDLAADFNLDGTTTSQDFFDFLAAFFAGC